MPKSTFYSANLTASTKTANVLAGDVNEFVPYRALVKIYAISSAIGVRVTVLADSDVVIDDKEISGIGTTLSATDHYIDGFMVAPGTRLAVFLRETAASATTDVYTSVEVSPI